MNLLLVTGSHASFDFVRCAEVAVNLLADQDRLDGCISKDDAGCEKAVDHSEYDLPWFKNYVSKLTLLGMKGIDRFLQILLA